MFVNEPQTTLCMSAGIDYVTATTKPGIREKILSGLARTWFASREAEGYRPNQWSFNGYVGETIDGLSYGQRYDSSIVRVSSDLARLHGRTVLRMSEHVSRLDVQVTLIDDVVYADWADRAYVDSRNDGRVTAGITRTSLRHDSPDGAMFTLGSRVSERYYRIYDKKAESKGVWPPGSWRWEIEYKGNRAVRVAAHLATDAWSAEACRSVVQTGFSDYGIELPCARLPRSWRDASPREETDDEKRLEWLRTSIRPTIERLRETLGHAQMLEVLGLDDVDLVTGEFADEQQKGDDHVHAIHSRRRSKPHGDTAPSSDAPSSDLRGSSVTGDQDRSETSGPAG